MFASRKPKKIPAVPKVAVESVQSNSYQPIAAMSTTMSQTQVKESLKAKSPDSHKARKRKHTGALEEPATEKKKKRKKKNDPFPGRPFELAAKKKKKKKKKKNDPFPGGSPFEH